MKNIKVETILETCHRLQGNFLWALIIALFMAPLSVSMMLGQPGGAPAWFVPIPLFVLVTCLWMVYATFTRWRNMVRYYSAYIDRMLGKRGTV